MMNLAWIRRIGALLVVASMTSGCIMYRLEELRNTTPQGSPFQTELSQMYMDFATQLEKEYDWFNSWHFADKGLMLAYGTEIGPEDLKDWDIPEEALPDLERARAMLVAVLTPDVLRTSPSLAAEAQFYFDCWVDNQEQNWQTDRISFCRDHMTLALEKLNAGEIHPVSEPVVRKMPPAKPKRTEKVGKHVTKTVVLAEKKDKESDESPEIVDTKKPVMTKTEATSNHPETISYAVFFETNKAQLSEPGRNVIGEVIGSLKNVSNYEVNLHVSDTKEGDATLSEERIQMVKKRLIEGGVSERSIKTSNTASEKMSGVRLNRRVEIFLNE